MEFYDLTQIIKEPSRVTERLKSYVDHIYVLTYSCIDHIYVLIYSLIYLRIGIFIYIFTDILTYSLNMLGPIDIFTEHVRVTKVPWVGLSDHFPSCFNRKHHAQLNNLNPTRNLIMTYFLRI